MFFRGGGFQASRKARFPASLGGSYSLSKRVNPTSNGSNSPGGELARYHVRLTTTIVVEEIKNDMLNTFALQRHQKKLRSREGKRCKRKEHAGPLLSGPG